MKISSASKKVLASALSAAMVVAFAPTVAFAAPAANDDSTGGATLTYVKDNTTKTESFDTLQKAVDAAAKANGTSTVITLAGDTAVSGTLDIAGVKDGMTIDMAGHTLSTTQEFYKGAATTIVDVAAATAGKGTLELAQFTNDALNNVIVKGTTQVTKIEGATDQAVLEGVKTVLEGTAVAAPQSFVFEGVVYNVIAKGSVKAGTAGYYQLAEGYKSPVATGTVTFKNGAITTFNAEEDYLAIDADAPIVLDGMTIAAEKGGTAVNATAKVTVKGDSDISTKATNSTGNGSIAAIESTGNVTVKAGKVTATDTGTKCAYAVKASDVTIDGGEIVVNDDNDTTQTYAPAAVYATATTVAMSAGTVTANYTGATKNAKGYAIYAAGGTTSAITGGAVNGALRLAAGSISGGVFTENLKDSNLLKAGYAASDDGTHSTVYFSVVTDVVMNNANSTVAVPTVNPGTGDVANYAVKEAADRVYADIMGELKAGKSISYKLADGVTKDEVVKVITDGAKTGKLQVVFAASKFDSKTKNLTDAQKAALDAATAAAAKNYDKVKSCYLVTTEIQYRAAGEREYKTLVTIDDFGKYVDGRTTVENYFTIGAIDADAAEIEFLSGDALSKVEQTTVNGKKINAVTATGVYAEVEVDEDAIKNAVDKPETPAEKATQGIDVSKKSMTVKLGAKKTKLAKAKSFSMGASAETELTTSKKSGSKYITVSGQKVKLAKGVKRGTYTAKVSLKAAASDAYLAAAKTITVKFVIK